MTRGRRPDAPALAAAKGNPGRRKRDTPAKRAAELAAAPGASADPLAPPAFLTDARLRPALAIWRELAGELRRLNLLDTLDRQTFAMYCVHMSDWIKATKDIAKNGHSYVAKNVNNDDLMRLNPAVKARQLAEKAVLEIGARFGLDPSNRYRLLRDQSAAPLSGGLFGGQKVEGDADAEATALPPPADEDPVGLMRRASGPPRTH